MSSRPHSTPPSPDGDAAQAAGLREVWAQIAAQIRPHVGADAFQRWFAAIELAAADEETLTLRAPSLIFQFWIESNYLPAVRSAVLQVLGAARRLVFVFREETLSAAPVALDTPAPFAMEAEELLAAREAAAPTERSAVVAEPTTMAGAVGNAAASSGAALNARYTFDTFVVGPNNHFAHAAAHAVAQAPAKTYNPLFIFGGVGLGKTHLMQAIGHTILGRRRGGRVVYVSSEQFANEFIDAIQHNTLVKFRRRYRAADVLLIDDIQFLANKERSQEEFFHTFNVLFDGHKQIVLSSDRPPAEIGGLEARLVSRFEWGLTAELQAPDIETRLAILRKKAEAMRVAMEPATLEFLARRIRSNVRRLEGALMRVASYVSLSPGGGGLTQERMENLLKDILQEEAKRTVGIDQIQRAVAEHYDVRLADMTSKRRPANIAFPRQVAMFLARELTKCSLNEIGDAFGGRDHGTVLHAHKLVKRRMGEDEKIRSTVSMLESTLQR